MATRNIRISYKKINISQPLILIDTFVLEKSEVKDRYYPGLWENLDPSDKKRTFFVPEFERNTISKIRKTIDILNLSEKKYLFKWEFLRIEDYFYAFTHYFRLRKIQVPPSIFRGIQFKELIQEELFTGLNSGMAMKAILNYRFFRRLKKLDIKIETAINWFENQGLDKGWNCGLHDFFPETKIKGYLGMIISQHYLPMFPTIIEAESKVIPDTLYVIGKGLEESIKEFYPELSVQTAPAFRFQGVYRDSIKKSVNSDHTVLVVLYSVLEDAVKSIKFALKLIRS